MNQNDTVFNFETQFLLILAVAVCLSTIIDVYPCISGAPCFSHYFQYYSLILLGFDHGNGAVDLCTFQIFSTLLDLV